MNGKLFNRRRLEGVTTVKVTVLRDLLLADDCALNADSQPEMQLSMDTLCSACDNFGLTISTKKTNCMHQPAPNRPYLEPSMYVKGQKLQRSPFLARSYHQGLPYFRGNKIC